MICHMPRPLQVVLEFKLVSHYIQSKPDDHTPDLDAEGQEMPGGMFSNAQVRLNVVRKSRALLQGYTADTNKLVILLNVHPLLHGL